MISLKNSIKSRIFLNPEKLQLQIIFSGFKMSNREVQKKVSIPKHLGIPINNRNPYELQNEDK
ncbi:hypothetical protein AD998_21870 [bacterium 336/3]|nr:hypothetical protein AD998_21870 [bacterium 336/3]